MLSVILQIKHDKANHQLPMHCPACALRSSLDWSAPARMCQICPGNVSMLRLACAARWIKDCCPKWLKPSCNPKEKYTNIGKTLNLSKLSASTSKVHGGQWPKSAKKWKSPHGHAQWLLSWDWISPIKASCSLSGGFQNLVWFAVLAYDLPQEIAHVHKFLLHAFPSNTEGSGQALIICFNVFW